METDIRAPGRILLVSDPIGGNWRFSLEIAAGLSARGTEVVFAVLGARPDEEQIAAAQAISGLQLLCNPLRVEWMDDPWEDVARSGDWLLRLAREFEPELVHLTTFAPCRLDWNLPVLLSSHSCVLSWWEAVHGARAPSDWDRYRKAAVEALRAAQYVVAPTSMAYTSLVRHHGLVRHGTVISDGISALPYASGPKRPFILCSGSFLDPARNLSIMERVAPRLYWPVRVAGETVHPDTNRPSEVPRTVRTHLLGRLSPGLLAETYAAASIFAQPAVYEPFGHEIIDAALQGCALVLGDIPSLREAWGNAAIHVPPRDEHALVQALNRLSTDPALRAEMAGRARRRAASYEAERMVDAYLKAYKETSDIFARERGAVEGRRR